MSKRSKRAEAKKYALIPHVLLDKSGAFINADLASKYEFHFDGRESCWTREKETQKALWFGGVFGRGTFHRSQPCVTFSDYVDPLSAVEEVLESDHEAFSTQEESLLLSAEEIVFLQYYLKCITVKYQGTFIDHVNMWTRLALCGSQHLTFEEMESLIKSTPIVDQRELCIDLVSSNDFLRRFVAYYFYRRQCIVVRSGIKYGTDYMLYTHGPALDHGFACVDVKVITPSIDPRIEWSDFFGSVRVCASVKKRYRICFLRLLVPENGLLTWVTGIYSNPDKSLNAFSVEEVEYSRWVPSRTR